MKNRKALCLFAAITLAPIAHAATGWNETADGDFSGNGLNPTFVTVAVGSNVVAGTTGDDGTETDLDYFRISVPAGSVLSSIMVLPGTTPDTLAFMGIQAGTQVTTQGAGALLGWVHYSNGDRGSDLLPLMGEGSGAIGFTAPLPAGDYAFWIQDYDYGASPYQFDFVVTATAPVPEPASMLMLSAGLGVLMFTLGRRRAKT